MSPVDPLQLFRPAVRDWFAASFGRPTRPQARGWPPIARGESTLILAPTGSGKTLSAFLWCLDRLMFTPPPPPNRRCRVLYVSPLKALAADVERNLRTPLAGIAGIARRRGDAYATPAIAVRTGDTPAAERVRFRREPSDILITTPESLYLLLTSGARDTLRAIDTVIIDEIHALVPTKRGAHLALSLERLAARSDRPPQRIGLSATQRPLEEVARFLGGVDSVRADRRSHAGRGRGGAARASHRGAGSWIRGGLSADELQRALADEFASPPDRLRYRPVTIVDAGITKPLKLSIEVPVQTDTSSIWSSIHPRLIELIRAHRSTLIFVNSRRLAERLAGALNEVAGETLVRSHHGSIARDQRLEVEELLKAGDLRALVATSSLELGIDMGAIDLVVQIEAPPSVASGLQRIGRAGHHVDQVSEGVIFPKFRGDLVACAAVARAMHEGTVEATRYPRNPLDIVAQQIVAMVAVDEWRVDDLFATIRSAAPFADLSRTAFDGVLDMLSGRYPSDEFAALRPRITWDRVEGRLTARESARRVAVINGGTIPDRGLYGVFLAGAGPQRARVGELDEEMVFESRVGETFVLGASSWRIEEITHDRVLVSPSPGAPGKMPFWRGDRAGRPLELGLAIGRLMRDLLRVPPSRAIDRLARDHDLDARAADSLLHYLREQVAATRALPDADTVIVERVRDELGDWRVCVLSPRGGRIHAPWAMAAAAKVREQTGIDVDVLWGDDGFVVRFPDVDRPPDVRLLLPDPDEVQPLVVRQLGATALFAAKFRENAARSLLLPKRRPGMRAPLWQQRKRAADLLAVASRYGSFPVLLETYRECLRDYFDMPALVQTLAAVRARRLQVITVDSDRPSPFAASLLYSYVASFLYEADAPLAERRAQALAVDQSQLRELLGDAELRDLLDGDAVADVERQLQHLAPQYRVRSMDALHDLLLSIGDLTKAEIVRRSATTEVAACVHDLVAARRALEIEVGGERRFIAVEDAVRYQDGAGAALPGGVADGLLDPVRDPLGDLVSRYARTHAPFTARDLATRFALTQPATEAVLVRLTGEHRLLEGEFRPGGVDREWTDQGVLRMLRSRSRARLRHEIEPVEQAVLGRLTSAWQGLVKRRQGTDGLLDAVELLQGAPVPASILETDILPARLERYDAADLDALMAAGEIVWVGLEPLGDRDGRIALYLADQLPRLLPPGAPEPAAADDRVDLSADRLPRPALDNREAGIIEYLSGHGASFFGALLEATGGGYPADTLNALWSLVWRGLVSNDTFHAVRAYTAGVNTRRPRRTNGPALRSRRQVPPAAEGRWSLVRRNSQGVGTASPHGPRDQTRSTRWAAALAEQLLARHGVLTREAVAGESFPGGFAMLYPVLKAMEERGRLRRGYFVAGLGATQFALPGALDLLRSLRESPDAPEVVMMAATDPANPYGAVLKFPAFAASAADGQARHAEAASAAKAGRGPTRSVGATVILVDGALTAYLARGDRVLLTWLPADEPFRSRSAREVARSLIERARSGQPARGMLIEEIDGIPATVHGLAPFLVEAGFLPGAMGMQARPTA